MREIERNRLSARLLRLEFTKETINRTLSSFQADLETFASASRTIDRLEREKPEQTILLAILRGLIAAVLGGWLATVG